MELARAVAGRNAGVRAIATLCAAGALVLAGCGTEPGGTAGPQETTAPPAPHRPGGPSDATGAGDRPQAAPQTAEAAATGAGAPATVVPEALLGKWTATDAFSTQLVYVFERDGTYKHAGVLVQQRDTGIASFTRAAKGTVRVRGRRMVLRPQRGTTELKDPDVPSASRTRPIGRTPERYTWALSGTGAGQRLALTDTAGATIEYSRR